MRIGQAPSAFLLATLASAVVTGCASNHGRGRSRPGGDPSSTVVVGSGRYRTVLSAGEKPPSNARGNPVYPKVTADFKDVPTSNDWWSSLIWQYDPDQKANPYSENMYPHPLTARAEGDGLALGYPTVPVLTEKSYLFPHQRDLLVGIEGLNAPETRVAGYSDWVVTASWSGATKPGAGGDAPDGAPRLTVTLGHGLPFVYAHVHGGRAAITPAAPADVWSNNQGVLGLTVNGHHFAVFGPRGSTWIRSAASLVSNLAGKDFFSVAVLPDRSAATLAFFRRHAYAFVTESRVSWRYDEATARLLSTFTVNTVLQESGRENADTALMALYPHQWMHTSSPLTPYAYGSPRGAMKVVVGNSFATTIPFHGVLPILPLPLPLPQTSAQRGAGSAVDAKNASALRELLASLYRTDDLFPAGLENTKGTYWKGKSLQKIAIAAWIADQIGYVEARDRFVEELRGELEDWFDGQSPSLFYYDRAWATLIGAPQEYKSGWQMNDHHFHAGYFIFAAATVAHFDPAWGAGDKWGGMVNLLIKDVANGERDDRRFPFMRNFDVYAGHSWANGPASFATGNNEESSSEDVNMSTAVLLWSAITGNRGQRDLAIFLYAHQAEAIAQYWFDVDHQVFPRGFDRPMVGIVWGAGGNYDTWWDRNPVYVHGINMLPMTGGSLYLGRRPAQVAQNYDALVKANGGEIRLWRDILWMFLALVDPERARALFDKNHYFEPEFGNSMAATYQWIVALGALGQVDTSVTADVPTHAVFKKGNSRTHVAFNPGSPEPTGDSLKVTFSDGVAFQVPPGKQVQVTTPAGRP